MRVDSSFYTGDAAVGGKVITLTNCVGNLATVDSVVFVFAYGTGGTGGWITTNSFDAGFAKSLVSLAAQVNTEITALGTGQFTVDGTCNANGVTYLYLVFQYDGITIDIDTGFYTGNGLDNQNGLLTYGAWTPTCVLTIGEELRKAWWRTSSVTGDSAGPLDGNSFGSNVIQSVNSGYAQLGTSSFVNASGETFQWFILGDVAGYLDFVTYTGNGVDDRDLSLTSFLPDMVFVKAKGNDVAVGRERISGIANSFTFSDAAAQADCIQAFNADGFQVGTTHRVNENTITYYAWCAKNYAGAAAAGQPAIKRFGGVPYVGINSGIGRMVW